MIPFLSLYLLFLKLELIEIPSLSILTKIYLNKILELSSSVKFSNKVSDSHIP